MATEQLIVDVLESFKKVTSGESDTQWVRSYNAEDVTKDDHQFLFFFKPEATVANIDKIMPMALEILEKAGVTFGAVRVVGGPYLDRHDIMVEHYGVISKISKEGYAVIGDDAKAKLQADHADDVAECGLPLGGHQFLAQNPDISPLALLTITDNIRPARLAGGTYLLKFKMLGQNRLVLNSFHAYQLVPFIKPGNALIMFECRSKLPWAQLRTNLCGATDPASAEEGSIRNTLLKIESEIGMSVDRSSNGVHMSAGPLEGMVELQRFLSEKDEGKNVEFTDLGFGKYLVESTGFSAEQVAALALNPDVQHDGRAVSVFDLTEERDVVDSAQLLKSTSQ